MGSSLKIQLRPIWLLDDLDNLTLSLDNRRSGPFDHRVFFAAPPTGGVTARRAQLKEQDDGVQEGVAPLHVPHPIRFFHVC